ncbi:MAG: LptF/LptG family permease [Spirochaetes bacterium]|nr:LptF/LptG family permease [Spirochaetota bacterium]
MIRLHKLLLREFLPVFLNSLLFFITILEMVDLFANLWRYLNQEVPLSAIAMIQWFYLPKCVSYSIPIALLFSIAYTLGDFHGKNQLIAVLGAGISLFKFISPLLLMGILLSLFSFYFQEHLVIDTYKAKNELFRNVLNTSASFSNSNVTILGDDVGTVYHAEYYDDDRHTLIGLLVAQRDTKGNLIVRIDAESAEWKGSFWELRNARLLSKVGEDFLEEKVSHYPATTLSTPPARFRKMTKTVDEMRLPQAREWIDSLRKAGLPYRETLTEYYKRFSFAASPLVVSVIAGLAGAMFRRNILLMSLLMSLILSVLYYVVQMMMVLLAKLGYIAPIAGAWSSFFLFLAGSILWIRMYRM